MKKQLLVALGFALTLGTTVNAQQDPVLMEVNGKKITKSEFLQVYLKNNNNPKYDKQTLDEYIQLYTKFQLKVAEAEALGYDTIPKLMRELEGYQKQLAQPYLTDVEMNKAMVAEAYKRMQSEVKAAHILIKVDENANAEDTLKAYKKIIEIRNRALKGEDFNKLATELSQDPSAAQNAGDLGYFTAFQMVYQFEEAAFSLNVGDISMPVRTRFGYHIIQLQDKRPARGTMKAAHLMIAANKEVDSPDQIEKARAKANEIYAKLKAGENYDQLVKLHSDDPSNNSNGGVLPLFGSGATTRMIPEFEEAAFALAKDGDFSAPVQSAYGFHIIKRLELTPLRSFDEMKKELEGRVNRDDRAKLTQNSYIEKLKKEYNFKDSSKDGLAWLNKNLDSTLSKGGYDVENIKSDKTLFELNGRPFTMKHFVEYLNDNPRLTRGKTISDIIAVQYPVFVSNEVVELEKVNLPVKHPEYKALMNEYHDGILLYEVMSDKVWNKAMKDTTGLQEFYAKNKANYMWDKRYDVVTYETANAAVAKQVAKMVKKKKTSEQITEVINKNTELNLRVRSGKFEVAKTPYLANRELKNGVNKPYEFEGKHYVVVLNEVIDAQPKELSEAKGIITSDYQAYLEQEWLREIAAKHSIKVNEEVLYSIGK